MNFQRFFIITAVLGGLLISSDAFCKTPEEAVEETLIQSKKNLEDLLTHKEKLDDLSAFLDSSIDQDVAIIIQTIEPGAGSPSPEVELSKADYINSYVYGPRAIKDYLVDIEITDFEYNASQNVATTQEIMTESGLRLDPWDHKAPGIQFTSKTKCVSSYTLEAQTPKLASSDCKTVILEEEDI